MDVAFTDLFKKECGEKLGIVEDVVREVLKKPSGYKNINYKGLLLEFYIKDTNRFYTLVFGRKDQDQLEVDLALEIKKEFLEPKEVIEPTKALQKLIEKFGLDIKVGNYSGKIVVAQNINILPGQMSNLVSINNPDSHPFLSTIFIRVNEQMTIAECALAFVLDTKEYKEWLSASNKQTQ